MSKGVEFENPTEIAERVCVHIAEGKSLLSLVKSDPTLPSYPTLMLWLVKGEAGDARYETFAKMYMTAREAAGHAHADKMIDLIEETHKGTIHPNAGRVAMEGTKWVAERMAARRYNPKGDQKSGITVTVNIDKDDAALL